MKQQYCRFCGKEVPHATVEARHYTLARLAQGICCDRKCDTARRQATGFYKKMSDAGNAARSVAVSQSNRVNPRRKKVQV